MQTIVSCLHYLKDIDLKLIQSLIVLRNIDETKLKPYSYPLVNLLVSMTINPDQKDINKKLHDLWKGMNKDGEFKTSVPNDAGNCFDALLDSLNTILFFLCHDENEYKPFYKLCYDEECENALRAIIDHNDNGKTHSFISNCLGTIVKEDYLYTKCECGYSHPNKTNPICHLKFVIDVDCKTKSVQLHTLLQKYFTKKNCTRICPHMECNKTINYTISSCMYNLPKLFIVELNRKIKGKTNKKCSVQSSIRGLDLSPYLLTKDTGNRPHFYYDLIHVIAHHDIPKNVGSHFTNYHFYKNSCWYHINDKSVLECTNDVSFKKAIFLSKTSRGFLYIFKRRESMY